MSSENQQLRDVYERDGYIRVPQVATKAVVDNFLALLQYNMTAGGRAQELTTSRVSVKPAYEIYSYRFPALMGFHWGLTSRIAEITGKELMPSFAFFRVYPAGDRLIVHSDRPACEHSFSMSLGYADNIMWGLEIGENHYDQKAAADVPPADDFGDETYRQLDLDPGDALLYQGVYRRHGRMTPNPNRWSAHLFLHWVDRNGPHAEWAFDAQHFPPMKDFEFPAEQASTEA